MELRPVKIYSQGSAARLNYMAEVILHDILGLSYEIITDRRRIGKNPAINYSSGKVPGALKMSPDSLLFEDDIKPRNLIVEDWDGLPGFFPTSPDSDFPFDIFASSFYLITRYEEYPEYGKCDESGCFIAPSSLAYRKGFLNIPVIELWAKRFARAMAGMFYGMAFKAGNYKSMMIFCTGNPFSVHGKNLLGNITYLLKEITGAKEQHKDSDRDKDDASMFFVYLKNSLSAFSSEAKMFFSAADSFHGESHHQWRNSDYRALIRSTSLKHDAGIYLTGDSATSLKSVRKEILRLAPLISQDILKSCTDPSALVIPESCRVLCDAGIKEDYSMGYPEDPGFRAGISRPFRFFDLRNNRVTGLLIIPYQMTDIALAKYNRTNIGAFRKIVEGMINVTRESGGHFVSLWHETSLTDACDDGEWKEIFEFVLDRQAW